MLVCSLRRRCSAVSTMKTMKWLMIRIYTHLHSESPCSPFLSIQKIVLQTFHFSYIDKPKRPLLLRSRPEVTYLQSGERRRQISNGFEWRILQRGRGGVALPQRFVYAQNRLPWFIFVICRASTKMNHGSRIIPPQQSGSLTTTCVLPLNTNLFMWPKRSRI